MIEKFPPYLLGAVIILTVVLVAVVNGTGPYELPDDPFAQIELLQAAGKPEDAAVIFEQLLEEAPDNLSLHFGYILNHFTIFGPEDIEDTEKDYGIRDDERLERRYQALAADPETADIGYYGLGLMRVEQERYEEALEAYAQVGDRQQVYLNNSTGYAYVQLKDDETAEPYFWREIEADGNVYGAVFNLVDLYYRQDQVEALVVLRDYPELGRYLSPDDLRLIALKNGEWLSYLPSALTSPFSSLSVLSIMSALIICLMWIIYFWRIDIFEQEPGRAILITLLFGVLSVPLTFFLSDILGELWPLQLEQSLGGDLLFNIFHIGLVEETAKFAVVVLVVYLFRKEVNEPLDLMIYGGLVALSFATVENALYFTREGTEIVFYRFLYSTVGHLTNTAVICYAWAYVRFIREKRPYLPIALALLLAAFIHGVYDFFIISFTDLAILSLFIVFWMAAIYGRMLNNALNFSPYFSVQKAKSDRLHNASLISAVALVLLLITYLYNTFTYSTELANGPLQPFSFWSLVTILLVFGALFELTLSQGTLLPLFGKRPKKGEKPPEDNASDR